MARTYKQLRRAIERVGSYPNDPNGYALIRMKPPRDSIVGGKKYYLERYKATPEDEKEKFRELYRESDDTFAIDNAFGAALGCAWTMGFAPLWQLDSFIRMIESGQEPRLGGTYLMTKGQPAREKRTPAASF